MTVVPPRLPPPKPDCRSTFCPATFAPSRAPNDGSVIENGTLTRGPPVPGKTTFPKLRCTPGVVIDVPPGNTTLPKLPVMPGRFWPKESDAKEKMTQNPIRVRMNGSWL